MEMPTGGCSLQLTFLHILCIVQYVIATSNKVCINWIKKDYIKSRSLNNIGHLHVHSMRNTLSIIVLGHRWDEVICCNTRYFF